jgi:hypothetical protein
VEQAVEEKSDSPTSPPELSVMLVNAPSTSVLNTIKAQGPLEVLMHEVLSAKPGEKSQLELLGSGAEEEDVRLTFAVDVIDWEKRILDVALECGVGRPRPTEAKPVAAKKAGFVIRSGKTAVPVLKEADLKGSGSATLAILTPTLIGGGHRAKRTRPAAVSDEPLEQWPNQHHVPGEIRIHGHDVLIDRLSRGLQGGFPGGLPGGIVVSDPDRREIVIEY